MWTKFKKKNPPQGAIINVKFGDGQVVQGKVEDNWIVYDKKSKIEPSTLTSGQIEWSMVQAKKRRPRKDGRGKAKKPRRKGREAIKDPKVVDPKNRPTSEEIAKKGSGGVSGNMERLVYKTIDWIKSGLSIDACREMICEEINPNTKRPFHERFADMVVLTANKLVKKDYELQRTEVISLHMQRYDSEIQALLMYQAPPNERKPWLEEEMNVAARMNCLGVLHQKEQLLGMHRKEFRIVINNEETIEVRDQKTNIDLSKLSLEEKVELNELIEKSRQTEDEIGGVILRSEQAKEIEDVEHEVISEKINIDRMENREPKVIEQPHPEGTALLSIQEKMRLALQRKAKEEIARVGSKTVEFDNIEPQKQ